MANPERKQVSSWWTRTRPFITVLFVIAILCLIIVYLLTPRGEREGFWIEVALAVAGAALVVILVHVADRLVLLREVSEQVDEALRETLDRRMIQSPWATGVVGIHDSLSDAEFGKWIESATDQEICIMDTYIPDAVFFTTKMQQALNHGCSFKFLVLDPDSDQAKARSELLAREGLDHNQFKSGTNTYLCRIASVCQEAKAYDRISIRLYKEPPVTPLYIFRATGGTAETKRDHMLLGFYLDVASYGSPHLEIARVGQPLFELFEEFFDRMWSRNETGQLEIERFLRESCPVGFRPS